MAFPFGTLAVNIAGTFLICAVMHLALSAHLIGTELRLFLTTGIIGGFTTYSAFAHETLQIARRGAYATSLLYVVATVILCLVAGIAGAVAARLLAS